MGRSKRVHPGQMDGAVDPRRAAKMPATNVPCWQAALLDKLHKASPFPVTLMLLSARSGWSNATGPSMRPTMILGLPRERSMRRSSRTNCVGLVVTLEPRSCVAGTRRSWKNPPADATQPTSAICEGRRSEIPNKDGADTTVSWREPITAVTKRNHVSPISVPCQEVQKWAYNRPLRRASHGSEIAAQSI